MNYDDMPTDPHHGGKIWLTRAQFEQLAQLHAAGLRGVRSGDLIDKPSTRELVRMGLADNGVHGNGSPSALGTVYINLRGRLSHLGSRIAPDASARSSS
jgi:hypothetical protein